MLLSKVIRPCSDLTCVFFNKSSRAIFQALKTLKLQRNGSVIHLFSNQVNRPYLHDKKTNCSTLQVMVAWNVFSYNDSTNVLDEGLARVPWACQKSIKNVLLFPTSDLCESGFSAMASTKTEPRNRLDVRDTLRVSLSSIIPRWERLVAAKQVKGSHWIKVVITYISCNKNLSLTIGGFLKAGPRKKFQF